MSEYQEVPVEAAKYLAMTYEKQIVVICCWSHEHSLLHTTTYGVSPTDKVGAAKAGEICAKALGMDLKRSDNYEDFRKHLDAGKQRAMEEAIKRHLPNIEQMAKQIIDPPAPHNSFGRMAADFRKALGE